MNLKNHPSQLVTMIFWLNLYLTKIALTFPGKKSLLADKASTAIGLKFSTIFEGYEISLDSIISKIEVLDLKLKAWETKLTLLTEFYSAFTLLKNFLPCIDFNFFNSIKFEANLTTTIPFNCPALEFSRG